MKVDTRSLISAFVKQSIFIFFAIIFKNFFDWKKRKNIACFVLLILIIYLKKNLDEDVFIRIRISLSDITQG